MWHLATELSMGWNHRYMLKLQKTVFLHIKLYTWNGLTLVTVVRQVNSTKSTQQDIYLSV